MKIMIKEKPPTIEDKIFFGIIAVVILVCAVGSVVALILEFDSRYLVSFVAAVAIGMLFWRTMGLRLVKGKRSNKDWT